VPVPAQEHTRHKDNPNNCMASRQPRDVVAVVEDDAGVREAIQGLLHSRGLKTSCFASAEQFLKSTRVRPACLILDLRLPGMTGLQLLRKLQADKREIPAICVSGELQGDRRMQAQLLRAGAVAVLTKPFDPEKLLHLVEGALGNQPEG
jgi:FixJ family two-component response regulator